jgi:carbonic anhydrase
MTLGVNDIVICGHYACGGIAASLGTLPDSPVGHWLQHVVDVLDEHRPAVECLHDPAERVNRLVEINVRDQLVHLAQTVTVQAAFKSGRPLKLHGWVYDLRDGLIKPLLDIDSSTVLEEIGPPERVLV